MIDVVVARVNESPQSESFDARKAVAAGALAWFLFTLTKGPVFWARREIGPISVDFIDDARVQMVFVVSALAVVVAAWPARALLRRDVLVTFAFALFVGLVLLSTAWSVSRARTIEQGVMLALCTAAGLLAGAYLPRLHSLVALWCAMQAGVALSYWAWIRGWSLAIDENGDLAGIFFNRNSLGPVALMAMVTSIVLLAALLKRSQYRAMVPLLCLIASFDALLWWRSGSLTSAMAAVLGGGLVAFWWAARRLGYGDRATLTTVAAGLGLIALVLIVAERTTSIPALHRSSTFSGRTVIWEYLMGLVGDRPFQGWGFMGVWLHPELINGMNSYVAVVHEAHSGYLEVLLGVGVFGLAALILATCVALVRVAQSLGRRFDLMSAWSFWLVVYAMAINLGETYVGANLLPWVLLTIGVGQAVAVLDR